MAQKLQLKAVKLIQPNKNNQDIFVTSIKVKYLLDKTYFKVNWWKREKMGTNKQGYQRKPTENRMKKIARYLEKCKNPIFPTNILINCTKRLNFISDGKSNFGTLELAYYPLWIVDGQTRTEGFRYAIDELKLLKILEYEIPVTVLSNFPLIDELEQFFILNSTQKKVSTDLAQRLKLQLATENPEEYKSLDIGEDWELIALKAVDLLNTNHKSIWYERIRLPNTIKSPINVISQNSFVKSLKPLYKEEGILELAKKRKPDDVYIALNNYWSVLKRIFSDAFEIQKDYVIQKTPGVFSLHDLATKVFGNLYSNRKEFTEDNIYKVLKKAFSDEKRYNSYFWQKDNYNGAALAGSMKGFARLASEFKKNLE